MNTWPDASCWVFCCFRAAHSRRRLARKTLLLIGPWCGHLPQTAAFRSSFRWRTIGHRTQEERPLVPCPPGRCLGRSRVCLELRSDNQDRCAIPDRRDSTCCRASRLEVSPSVSRRAWKWWDNTHLSPTLLSQRISAPIPCYRSSHTRPSLLSICACPLFLFFLADAETI